MPRLALVATVLTLFWPLMSTAGPPAPLDTAVYGRLPNIDMVALSPSGERIAYIQVADDKRALFVKDLSGRILFSGSVGVTKVRGLDWAGESHLIVEASETQRYNIYSDKGEYPQSIVVNIDTNKGFVVWATSRRVGHGTFGFYGAVAQSGRWYGYFVGEAAGLDLFKVDLDSGDTELAAPGRQRYHQWALDASGKVLAEGEFDDVHGDWTLRAGAEGGRLLARLSEPLGEVSLAGLGRTPGTVAVDKAEPEEWSVADGNHVNLVADRLIDGYLHDPTSRRLVGVTLYGDRTEQQFFDPVLKARQAALVKALGGPVWLSAWNADFSRMIVYTEGDGDAGTYWLINGKEAKPFGYAYPEIPDANVGASRMIIYKATDGLKLQGVLTLPPGREPKGLPIIVMPHGGPEAHDSLGFDWWAQAFAGQGYAVFQPNFRGSDGYGLEFRDAGFGQWGRKMQTDVSDGLAELGREGVIYPKRACIVGASYGGYVALAGVTVQQGLYRCAVSYGGISDLHDFLGWITPAWVDVRNPGTRYLRKFIGVKDEYDPAMDAFSPARLAGRADAPVLLIHGADDSVVPIAQSRKMEAELKRAGKPVEFLLLKGEDHWLSSGATRKAMLAASVAFVESNNPPDRP